MDPGGANASRDNFVARFESPARSTCSGGLVLYADAVSKGLLAVVVSMVTAVVLGLSVPASAVQPAGGAPHSSYIVIDGESGNVIEANNEHVALPPASITKLMTALVAVNHIDASTPVTITADAARMPPMKIGLGAGQTWTRDHLLHSLLMVSANDAAVALAEASGGTLEGFARQRAEAARTLGLQDNPVFNDPAGLDDAEFSHLGGDKVSARDMAIIARAALADPTLRPIMATKRYEFVGGDGASHVLKNHNQMLNNYSGAIGMKPGYTTKAKHTMVAAAERNGRTMIAISMGGDNPYAIPASLMDKGFATPAAAETEQGQVPLSSLQQQNATAPPEEHVTTSPVVESTDNKTAVRAAGGIFIFGFVVASFYERRRELGRWLAGRARINAWQ